MYKCCTPGFFHDVSSHLNLKFHVILYRYIWNKDHPMLVPAYEHYYRGVPYYFGIDPVCRNKLSCYVYSLDERQT